MLAGVPFREQDDAATLPFPGQEEEHLVLVGRQAAEQVQLQAIGENQFQVRQDDHPLALEDRTEEQLEGGGHMRRSRFRAPASSATSWRNSSSGMASRMPRLTERGFGNCPPLGGRAWANFATKRSSAA